MTDKLHCPFCGASLKEGNNDNFVSCFDTAPCPCYEGFRHQVYQALIDGKKAQDALAGIGKILLLHTNKPTVLTVKGKQEIRRRIASITKGESND